MSSNPKKPKYTNGSAAEVMRNFWAGSSSSVNQEETVLDTIARNLKMAKRESSQNGLTSDDTHNRGK
jgi:hypothetical protein